ncbi:hypothetical protein [Streptomyces mutomycini]|uniref:Uncharacterized protein n=1 Tax=Streptomyces mutomycini TaxID=284036 RepID=A0ABW0B7S6_9ACTN|nr:hypothetical protein [Streptomyces mutomycini]
MADRTSHTPLCSISWTDVVQGAQHSSFGVDQEVELRFGLELDRSFWSSFETSQFFTQFCVYRFGELVKRFDHSGDTRQLLPGAPETQIWLGVALGRAGQASGERSGLVQFRPQIFSCDRAAPPTWILSSQWLRMTTHSWLIPSVLSAAASTGSP